MAEHANPHYDPAWHGRLAMAEAGHVRAQIQCDAAMAMGFGLQPHRDALERLEQARDELRLAQLARFPRVADYAAWLFAGLEEDGDGFAVIPDFAAFTSIAEVDAAHERAARRQREGMLEEKSLLRTGQPASLTAFADAEAVISTWRLFGTAETGIECMISFHETGTRVHVCLAHPWGGLHGQSNEAFRRIATQLARESILLRAPATAPVFQPEGHRQAQNRELIREVNALAASFRFYRHLLPGHGLREEFARVDMGWNGASFYDPDWSAELYSTLPEVLRRAAAAPSPSRLIPGTARLAPDGCSRFSSLPESGQTGSESPR